MSQPFDKLRTPLSDIFGQTLAEVHASVEAVSSAASATFLEALTEANHVFLTGQGRTGLMTKAFAMRLSQLGFAAYVVGETTTPAIRQGDALVACSGSGRTATTCLHAAQARETGARILAVTGRPASPLARLADRLLLIPTPSSEQLGNSRFEQCLLLLFDTLSLLLCRAYGIPPERVMENHANLE